jgi:facilitated trehalose transporter
MSATMVVGAVQLVASGASTLLADRAGRRPLLLISAAIMTASMAAMGASFYLKFENTVWLGLVLYLLEKFEFSLLESRVVFGLEDRIYRAKFCLLAQTHNNKRRAFSSFE